MKASKMLRKRYNRTIMSRIKVKIYHYTGIYLFHKEELEYLTSKEFWKQFPKELTHMKDMSPRDVQGLMIGLWQCKLDLARPMVYWAYKVRGTPLYPIAKFLENIHCGLRQLKWDILKAFGVK